MSQAFNTVDYSFLLPKLNHYGIREQILSWFDDYLKSRKQFTSPNNKQSEPQVIKYGVPQGSVLGLMLFLLYTNDMAHCTTEQNLTHLFTGD